jgi:hypothetical protein
LLNDHNWSFGYYRLRRLVGYDWGLGHGLRGGLDRWHETVTRSRRGRRWQRILERRLCGGFDRYRRLYSYGCRDRYWRMLFLQDGCDNWDN